MKLLRQIGACFLALSISLPNAHAHEPFGDADSIRRYLVLHDFFDLLNNFPNAPNQLIEAQLLTGLRQTIRLYGATIQQWARDQIRPTLASIAVIVGLATALHAGSNTVANLFGAANPALAADVIRSMATFLPLTFVPFPVLLALYQLVDFVYPPKLPEYSLILAYGAKKRLLDKRTQNHIENELFYSFWRRPGSDSLIRLQKILDQALRLPFYSKNLVYNKEKVAQALRYHSPELRERLQRFVYAELIYQRSDHATNDTHYPVYFQGPPGTGKTHVAKQLAEAMGTNLAVVTLDGATIDDIIGTPCNAYSGKAGRFLDAITARTVSSLDINHYNQILLIDEFDRLFISGNEKAQDILSFMLKLLDPTQRSFYSPYLQTEVRLPDTIILAGNRDIHALSVHDPELEAMASRLDKVVFAGFTAETKKAIAAETMIPNKEQRYRSAGQDLAEFTLPEAGHDMINSFIETDNDPGLRSLEKYVAYVFESFARVIDETSVAPEATVEITDIDDLPYAPAM